MALDKTPKKTPEHNDPFATSRPAPIVEHPAVAETAPHAKVTSEEDPATKRDHRRLDRASDRLVAVFEEIKKLSGTLSDQHLESLEAAVFGVRDAVNHGKTPKGEPETEAEIFPTPPLTPDSLTLVDPKHPGRE